MSYTDLDPLSAFTAVPSTWLAQLLANTEALHDGSGFDSSASISKLLSNSACRFRVWRSGAANTGNGAYAAVAFDNETFDSGNNVASGTFTVPVTGFYQFNWDIGAVLSGGVDEVFLAGLFVNGAETSRGSLSTGRNDQSSHGSDILSLTAAQTVDIRAFCTTTRALSPGSSSCYFSGHLVSKP